MRRRSWSSRSRSTSATARRSPSREALGLGEQHTVLVDGRLTVPRQVGRRLALAGGRVDVGGQAAGGRRPAQQLAVLGPPDRDRAARQVEEQRRARERRLGARRDGDPHVLADLGVDDEAGDVVGGEEQVRAERHVGAADADLATLAHARGELPRLVELAVGGRIGLRHHAEHAAAVDDDRAVVDAVAVPQRRTEDDQRQEVRGALDHRGQRALDVVEHRILEDQVLERVARQGHLREQRHHDALLRALPGRPQHQLGVHGRVGDRHATRAGGDADEAVLVDRVEVHVSAESYPLRCGAWLRPLSSSTGSSRRPETLTPRPPCRSASTTSTSCRRTRSTRCSNDCVRGYRALEIDGRRQALYESVYLDTGSLRCFQDHVEGRNAARQGPHPASTSRPTSASSRRRSSSTTTRRSRRRSTTRPRSATGSRPRRARSWSSSSSARAWTPLDALTASLTSTASRSIRGAIGLGPVVAEDVLVERLAVADSDRSAPRA